LTPGLTIRRAAAGDAGRLTAIAREAKASWGYPARWLSAWESSLRIPPDYIRRQTVFVCEEGQDMIGFCALEDRDGTWHLEHLWVDPRRHGIGAGRLLFERAAAWIGQVRPGRLMVESDPNAAGFYARLGARRTGWVAAPVEGAQDRRLPVLEWEIAPPKQPTS